MRPQVLGNCPAAGASLEGTVVLGRPGHLVNRPQVLWNFLPDFMPWNIAPGAGSLDAFASTEAVCLICRSQFFQVFGGHTPYSMLACTGSREPPYHVYKGNLMTKNMDGTVESFEEI